MSELVAVSSVHIETDKPYKIFAEFLEQGAIDQFTSAMQQPYVVRGALMPDSHFGYTLPIGGVIATVDFILPSYIGFDIGCGMVAIRTSFNADSVRDDKKKIFDQIYRDIPVGFNHNKVDSIWEHQDDVEFDATDFMEETFAKNGLKQLGSLGGGNHFIEIGADANNQVWIIIHSGSRGIGHHVASHYMALAHPEGKKSEGHFGFDTNSKEGQHYIQDMNFCLEYALANRKEMISRVIKAIQRSTDGEGYWSELINRNHNHAQFKDGVWIHRKGATHAEAGMMGVIPGNMRDGSFIVRGKGNQDSMYSSSHGAGRVLGRNEAQKVLNMEQFTDAMVGIQARVRKDTLDESPFAYKDIFDVMRQQSDLVDIVAHVKPIINIKG